MSLVLVNHIQLCLANNLLPVDGRIKLCFSLDV